MTKEDSLTWIIATYMEMVEGSAMILRIIEKEATRQGMHLRQRAKQRNKIILQHIKALRNYTEDDTFENEHQAFSENWDNYEKFRLDASIMARICLLLMDRTYHDNDLAVLMEAQLRNKPEKGIIPREIINELIIK